MNTKDLALHFTQDLKLRIFPCYPRGHEKAKQPMVAHWKEDATTLEGVTRKNFGGPVDKLIGLLMEANGLFAVDIDTPEAAATWEEWRNEYGMAEPGPWQKTPRGAHYIFKMPAFDFSSAVGKLAPGMDLRADGYICTGGDGSGYTWQIPLDEGAQEAPDWLQRKIKAIAAITTTERSAPANTPPLNPELTAAYWLKHYAQKAAVGTRNENAYLMGLQLYYAGISLDYALSLYQEWSTRIPQDPSNRFTSFEYAKTIKSAYSGERKDAGLLPAEAVKPAKIEPAKAEAPAPAKSEPKAPATSAPEPQKTPKIEGKAKSEAKPPAEVKEVVIDATFSTWTDLDGMLGPLEWEWENWLAKGFLHILVGQTGEGKSRLALRVAATYLTDLDFPDGTPYEGARGSIGWAEAEAGQAMNRDRAKAMGLPTDHILSPLSNPLDDFRLTIPEHQARLADLAMRPDVKIIVVDSLSGADPTAEKSTEDAKSINWLAALARDCQKPILLTHHLRKRGMMDTEGEVDLDRVRGISTILQYARVIWAIDTPDLTNKDLKRLSVIKSNLGKKPDPIGFTINDKITFTDAPSKPKVETLQDRGIDLLLNILAKGATPAKTIEEEFNGAGLSKRTLWEAKKALSVVSIKHAGKGWLWSLPAMVGGMNE